MGAGKSTVGRLVAHSAGVRFVDLDTMIEAAVGASVAQIFDREGEQVFRRRELELLPKALGEAGVVALGGGAPMAGPNWELIRAQAVSVWLDTPFETVWDRISGAGDRPLLRGRSRSDVERLFDARRIRYAEADHRVDGSGSPVQVAEEVTRLWTG